MPRQQILISSLGDSPAVVTEAIDKLEAEGIRFDYVITLGTWADKVRQGAELLDDHIYRHYDKRIKYLHQYAEHREGDAIKPVIDPITPEENIAYLKLVAQTLRGYRNYSDMYVSISGGRKTMSALVTLAVQIYGARQLCHVVHLEMDEQLERKMGIDYLRNCDAEERQSLLHPPLEKIALVRLPVVSLFSMLREFQQGLKDPAAASSDRVARQLLEESQLIEKTPDGWHVTTTGKELGDILSEIETLPPPSALAEKEVVLHKHHGQDELKPHADRIREFPYAQRIISTEFQSQFSRAKSFYTPHGRLLVEVDPANVDALLVTLADSSRGYRLKVFTNAQSKEQAEAVRKALEQFLGKEG